MGMYKPNKSFLPKLFLVNSPTPPEIGFLCVARVVLELALQTRQTSNSKIHQPLSLKCLKVIVFNTGIESKLR